MEIVILLVAAFVSACCSLMLVDARAPKKVSAFFVAMTLATSWLLVLEILGADVRVQLRYPYLPLVACGVVLAGLMFAAAWVFRKVVELAHRGKAATGW